MDECVYLVEDDPDIAYIIKYLLEDEGMSVIIFSTIKSLQAAIEKKAPNLFILDVNLPDGNGLALCNAIKKDSRWRKISVLILSAHATADDFAKSTTADAYLSKPFDLNNLLATVNSLIKE